MTLIAAFALEFYATFDSSENGVILTHANIVAGMEFGATLTNDDAASGYQLAVMSFGAEVVFEEVLTVVNDADVKIGKPVVEGAKVVAKVVEHGKADKIFVFKYKAKSNYRKRQGHRQPFTAVEIVSINA